MNNGCNRAQRDYPRARRQLDHCYVTVIRYLPSLSLTTVMGVKGTLREKQIATPCFFSVAEEVELGVLGTEISRSRGPGEVGLLQQQYIHLLFIIVVKRLSSLRGRIKTLYIVCYYGVFCGKISRHRGLAEHTHLGFDAELPSSGRGRARSLQESIGSWQGQSTRSRAKERKAKKKKEK